MDDPTVFAISIVIYTSIITIGTMLIMFRFCRGIHKQRMERKISISTSGASNSPHSSRETHPAFHNLANILFVLTICGYWNHVAYAISTDDVVGTVDNVLYFAQSYLVTMFWVIRVYRSFEGSELQFSSCARYTINIFMALFGVFAISVAVALFWIGDEAPELVTILLILFFLSMFSTSGVFVYKLIRIYQKIMKNEKVIGTITKIVILNFASVLMTIINAVVYLTIFDISDFGRYVHHYIMILEFFVNFKCVTLSFHYYSKEYMKLCGPIHGTCSLCWSSCISPEENSANNIPNMKAKSDSIGSSADGSPRSRGPSDLEGTTV